MRGAVIRLFGACALAVSAGSLLWRSLEPLVLLRGAAAGVVGALVCAAAITLARSLAGRVVATIVVLASAAASAAVAVGDQWGVRSLSRQVGTFLTVGLPVERLDGMGAVPWMVVFPSAVAALVAARRGRMIWEIGVPSLFAIAAAFAVLPVGVPVLAVAAFVASVVLVLVGGFDARWSRLPALVPLSVDGESVGRRQGKVRVIALGLPAMTVGLACMFLPLEGRVEPRDWVEADTVLVRDENPLATAARMRRDSPGVPDAVSVVVRGASPGRMRVAVLGGYDGSTWDQQARFEITGGALDRGPLFAQAETTTPAMSAVAVVTDSESFPFRAIPTAGAPISVDDPNQVRYEPRAGVLLPLSGGRDVQYVAEARPDVAADAGVRSAGAPELLTRCPDSPVLRSAAATLAAGTESTTERLRRIEAWLKLTRVYDPEGIGGQTVRSVERFVGVDFSRGNLEVFVSAFALLARCADVPVRIVVGLPSPAADASTRFASSDVTAWVETPVSGKGWVSFDPVPTPSEQQRQAQIADEPAQLPTPVVEPEAVGLPPRTVVPVSDPSSRPVVTATRILAIAALAIVGFIVLAALVGRVLQRLTLRRRRARSDPAGSTIGAWTTMAERLNRAGVLLTPDRTPREIAAMSHDVAQPVPEGTVRQLADLADRARYAPELVSEDDADRAWRLVDALGRNIPDRRGRRVGEMWHVRRHLRSYVEANARREW